MSFEEPGLQPQQQTDPQLDQPQRQVTRILSIQSHVISGYVGNRAAVFPLQLLGYDVDILNSCMLSNHTGYANGAMGLKLSGDDLTTVISGMRQNGLLSQVTHVLTGYIGSTSFLDVVVDTIVELRQSGPLVYVCDPVLGDNGMFYVPKTMVDVYIDRVLQHATILTPNAFELGLLSGGREITSETGAFEACKAISEKHGISTIFVTGTRFQQSQPNKVSILVSVKHPPTSPDLRNGGLTESRNEQTDSDGYTRFAVEADVLDGHFTGTGDLISALILAWTNKLPDNLQAACCHAMASVTGVLQRTVKLPKTKGVCPFYELRLIQSQAEILQPPLDLVRLRKF